MWERLPAAIVDTHLGFDLPFRARIKRRRRGPDFFVNFERALMPALDGKVEPKGYLILEFVAGALRRWIFHELPSRPMRQLDLYAAAMSGRTHFCWRIWKGTAWPQPCIPCI